MLRILTIAVLGVFVAAGAAQAQGFCSGSYKTEQQTVQTDQTKKPTTTTTSTATTKSETKG